jgi:N-acetylmuramoyl-L-alanine amidase
MTRLLFRFSQKMLRNISSMILFLSLIVGTTICTGQINAYSIKKIVIDAGHGGKDPGATIGKSYEKDIVLDVALKTGKLIKKMYPEIQVIYTRDCDVFVPLMDRAEIANKQKADLFMSIHANICSTESTSGSETYILGQHRIQENLDVAKLENSVILLEDDYSTRYEGFDPNSAESYIMFELIQNEFLEQSRLFADKVQNHFVSHAKRKDRGVRQAGFLVLRKIAMPSVLIELGFMSNKSEIDFMGKELGKTQLAESIVKAFSDYKLRFDERNTTNQQLTNKSTTSNTTSNTATTSTTTELLSNQADSLIDVSLLKGKWFGIQIMAIKNKLDINDPVFKSQTPVCFIVENGFYKYFLGLTQDSKEILKTNNKIKQIFKDSFLVSFIDGQKKSFK